MRKYAELYQQQKLIFKTKARYQLITGGIGTFKTSACVLKLFNWCLMYAGSKIFVLAQTYGQLLHVFQAEWESAIPSEYWAKNNNSQTIEIKGPNGKSELILAYADHPKAIERIMGSNCTGFYITQAEQFRSESMFDKLDQRVRLYGDGHPSHIRLMDANPGAPSHFINRRYLDHYNPDYVGGSPEIKQVTNDITTFSSGKLLSHIHVKTTPRTSIYSAETIEYWRKTHHPLLYQRMIEGVWNAESGAVYGKEFDRRKHVKDFEPNPAWEYWLAVDYGYKNPFVALIIGVDNDNRAWICQELYRVETQIKDIALELKPLVELYKIGNMVNDNSEPNARLVINDVTGVGVVFAKGFKQIRPGIDKVRQCFRDDLITIHSSCAKLIVELESYSFHDTVEGKEAKEVPKKLNDHGPDALRYFAMTVL